MKFTDFYCNSLEENLAREVLAVEHKVLETQENIKEAHAKIHLLRKAYSQSSEREDVGFALMLELAESVEVAQRLSSKVDKLSREVELLKQRHRRMKILSQWRPPSC